MSFANRLILWFFSSAAALGLVSHAHATGEIYCKAADGRSGEIHMVVGRSEILYVASAHVSAFGRDWNTTDGQGTKIVVGQAFQDRTQLFVDFMDDNSETILISLRTVRQFTDDEYGEAGILRIAKAVYPVVCDQG